MKESLNSEYQELLLNMEQCTICHFADARNPPKVPIVHDDPSSLKIMFIDDHPSWESGQTIPMDPGTETGRVFYHHYIDPLKGYLSKNEYSISTLTKCRYPKSIIGNLGEYTDTIDTSNTVCAEKWLKQEIILNRPRIIVTLGNEGSYQHLRKIFHLIVPSEFGEAAYTIHQAGIAGYRFALMPACHPIIFLQRRSFHDHQWQTAHLKNYANVMNGFLEGSKSFVGQ